MELISREKVFAIIKKEMGEVDSWRILREINKMPTIESRPKGKWVQISPAKIYECSVCNQNVMTNDIECYNYCHHCGTDMRGKE